jgi:UDP-N-acetylmuramoyl-L-alanyl-D-glutamate--2,6-diaminopimelate ligase
MTISKLINECHLRLLAGSPDTLITDVTDDSRAVTAGALFIARTGTSTAGSKFIADAVAKGAAAVLADWSGLTPPAGVAALSAPQGATLDHAFVGQVAEAFHDHPAKKLRLIGVTGTNGKTTIGFVIQHLLQNAGIKTGLLGTVTIDDGENRINSELTTPGSADLSRYFAAMVAHGCQAAVMEVSSHALHQGRTAALDFDVAIFTNLTGDHLDYHKTMDAYADAKAILFDRLRPDAWAVVNADDPYAARMVRDTAARIVACTTSDALGMINATGVVELAPIEGNVKLPAVGSRVVHSTCRAQAHELQAGHTRTRLNGSWGSVEVNLPLVGMHNVMNVLQATAAAGCVVELARTLRDSLSKCPAPPGRLEPVRITDHGCPLPSVFVDYAHTHDALENVMKSLAPLVPTNGKLTVVFGCGGDRDRTKRPKMAAIACKYGDTIVITSDNPRTEDPDAIIAEILAGVPSDMRDDIIVNPDREQAIHAAIAQASADDIILIAGKGHEDYQIIGTAKRHFDDRETAAAALKDRNDTVAA